MSVGMWGDAITEPGTPHYVFHQSLEQFWDPYRNNGGHEGRIPTNAMYSEALQRALQSAGRSPEEASYLARQAATQRAKYGLRETDPVSRVPNRLERIPLMLTHIRHERGNCDTLGD